MFIQAEGQVQFCNGNMVCNASYWFYLWVAAEITSSLKFVFGNCKPKDYREEMKEGQDVEMHF